MGEPIPGFVSLRAADIAAACDDFYREYDAKLAAHKAELPAALAAWYAKQSWFYRLYLRWSQGIVDAASLYEWYDSLFRWYRPDLVGMKHKNPVEYTVYENWRSRVRDMASDTTVLVAVDDARELLYRFRVKQ